MLRIICPLLLLLLQLLLLLLLKLCLSLGCQLLLLPLRLFLLPVFSQTINEGLHSLGQLLGIFFKSEDSARNLSKNERKLSPYVHKK